MLFGRKRFTAADRITLSLVLLSTTSLTILDLVGFLPSPDRFELRRKTDLCESLAINCSLLAQRGDLRGIEDNLESVTKRNPDIRSACVRRADGREIGVIGDHAKYWHLDSGERSLPDNIFVPIANGSKQWGTVEISFERSTGWLATLLKYPLIALGMATMVLNALLFRWYMGKMLSYLDPSKAVPAHVRATLDTFAEGVVVLDGDQRIVLANESFRQNVGYSHDEIQGARIDRFKWVTSESDTSPWKALQQDNKNINAKLALDQHDGKQRVFLVNASPIAGSDQRKRGTIVSFDDITQMEQRREQLSSALNELRESRDELSRRNEELQYLATRDPLTGCVNRRTFFETFENQWNTARRFDHPLSCVMVDIDHFKSINDTHGHSMGDEVLRKVSAALRESVRDADVVCRYGGEEFCILMPHLTVAQATQAAERVRVILEELEFDVLSVTASLGVSSIELQPESPQELLDQADKCLYVAKRNGRNQVVRWDEVPDDMEVDESKIARTKEEEGGIELEAGANDIENSIPYPAVVSLLSALAYRDADTAAHSTRVAELCAATARGLMSVKDAYVLEIAALLHDIGKIGVPDAILLKPGPLTSEEWRVMQHHDQIGVEIVASSFPHPQLVEIVRFHHTTFAGNADAPGMPAGKDIPLGARIVTIVDSYDAMVSDRVYRKGRPQDEAFAELRRCAGSQFDPELVEHFIKVVREYAVHEIPGTNKQSALQIGLHVQRLAQAVDDCDQSAIQALAGRLAATASSLGIEEIEARAKFVEQEAEQYEDLESMASTVMELIELCQTTQKAYVETAFESTTNS